MRIFSTLLLAGVIPTLAFVGLPSVASDTLQPRPEHGLRFTNAVTVWDEALPLGNGMLGGLVWGDGQPLKISLDRTDLWDLRPVPEFHSPEYSYATMQQWHADGRHADLVRLYEAPYNRPAPTKIPAGRIELQLTTRQLLSTTLDLTDALATIRFDNGLTAEVFVHATDPVGMIRIRASGEKLNGSRHPLKVAPQLVAPPFGGDVTHPAQGGIGAGDLAQLGYPPPEEQQADSWQAFRQKGALGFEFAVFLAWQETENEWTAAWSVASSLEGRDPLKIARSRAGRALRKGFENTFASHRDWWERFWAASGVRVPNPAVERQWYLEQYKFGAASRRGAPPITLQGPWTADNGQLPPWKGDYHHDLNTQLSYWPCYSGNHLEEGLAYLDWLWQTRSNCFDWTRRFFDLPGLNVPMTADLHNEQIGGWRQYTHSATTGAWLAHHFYLHWKYSADRRFLRDRAFPYLRDVSIFLEAVTRKRGADGLRTLPLSASPEIHDNRPEAWFSKITNYDLALIRWAFSATAELAEELNRTEEALHWRSLLRELPDLSLGDDGELLVAPGEPLRESHRHFSHLMALHPLGLIDLDNGPAARRTVEASLEQLEQLGTDWWCGYSFSWLGNLAARARQPDKAERALELFATAFTLRNSFHCNGDQSGQGHSRFTYRPFTLEGNFAMAAGLQEMLLQSHRGYLEVFPAIPDRWRDASFASLRAQGAFLVSAERRQGRVERVIIQAEHAGVCRLLSPFSGRLVEFALKRGERRELTADP